MKILLIILVSLRVINIQAQEYFSKNYTFDFARSTLASDFIEVDNSILVASSHICYEDNEKCTSIIKIDPNGEVLDQLIVYKFKNGNERCIIRKNDSIFVSGHSILGDFESINFFKSTNDLDDFKTFIFNENDGSKYWNEGLISHGNAIYSYGDYNPPDNDTGEASILKWDNSLTQLDTIFRFKYGDGINWINDLQSIGENKLAFIILSKYRDEAKDFYNIIEIDNLGNLFSRIEFEDYPSNQLWPNLLVLPNGDYIIGSNTNLEGIIERRGQIARLKSQTDSIVWKYRLPFEAGINYKEYSVFDMKLAKNGDILLSGQLFDKETQFIGYYAGFITRLSQDGEVIWQRIYKITKENPAAPFLYKSSNLRSIHELPSGDIAGVGWSISYDENINPRTDLWVLRVGPDGCLYEDCEEEQVITTTEDVNEESYQIELLPNPTNGLINISADNIYKLTVFDLLGKALICRVINTKSEIDISHYPAGMYLFQFEKDGKYYIQKIIKTD